MKLELKFDENNITTQALNNLFTDGWGYNGVELTNESGIECTKEEIDAEVTRLQAEYDAQAYARNREAEYPSTGDQLDMMYKDTKNSTTTHADAVETVKTKWQKDNSGPV